MKLTGKQLVELVKDGLTGKVPLSQVAEVLADYGITTSEVVIRWSHEPDYIDLEVSIPNYEAETRD